MGQNSNKHKKSQHDQPKDSQLEQDTQKQVNIQKLLKDVKPKWVHHLTRAHEWYFKPTFLGTEHLSAERPAMYVGNHTLYGVIDTPLLIDYLMNECGIVVISMADHVHFHVPIWDKVVKSFGGVHGLRENARAVMQAGYSILIFPGGGREVTKRKGEQYQLIWKERYGFLRLAQEFGYDIVPFAAYGGDDVFEPGLDANDVLKYRLSKQLLKIPQVKKLLRDGEIIPTFPKSIIPKKVPLYFQFLARINAPAKDANQHDLQQLRELLQSQIYTALDELKTISERDI